MLWSGSSPFSVVRDGLWGFLLFAGVTWLAISWSVLRLEPADIAGVAGPVVLVGALTEALRALAGTRTWGLNAGMAVLFAASGAILLADGSSTWTAPAALIGWYLMVRGAADLAIGMLTRESDRIWGLLTVLGVVEAGLGFAAAGTFGRTAENMVVVLAGAALLRGIADLVAALRLRESSVAQRAESLLELPEERAVGVAGYAAGLADFNEAPARDSRPRHRAAVSPRMSAAGLSDLASTGNPADLSASMADQPGTAGYPNAAGMAGSSNAAGMAGLSNAAGMAGLSGAAGMAQLPGAAGVAEVAGPVTGAGAVAGAGAAAGAASAAGGGYGGPSAALGGPVVLPGSGGGSFHDEVLRTTADLDARLAEAGVTGSGGHARAAAQAAEQAAQVRIPDTAEGFDGPAETFTPWAPEAAAGDAGYGGDRPASAAMFGAAPSAETVFGGPVFGDAGGAPSDPSYGSADAAQSGSAFENSDAAQSGSAYGDAGSAQSGSAYGDAGSARSGLSYGHSGTARGGAAYGDAAPGGTAYDDAGGVGFDRAGGAAFERAGGAAFGGTGAKGVRGRRRGNESSLPLLDPAARAAEAAMPGMDDTSIIARGYRLE